MKNAKSRPFSLRLLLSMAALLYVGTMPLKHGLGDAPDEIALATSSTYEVRPHHLLTSVWNRALLQALPSTDRPRIPLQGMMIVTAIIAGWLLYCLLLGLVANHLIALAYTGLFLVSNGVWIHATIVETGIIPLALLIASLLLIGRKS